MTDYERLGLPHGASMDDLRARWRELAFALHPDRGGDPQAFIEVEAAYRRILNHEPPPQEVEPEVRRERCGSCDGSGKVRVTSGFHQVAFPCQECDGEGYVEV